MNKMLLAFFVVLLASLALQATSIRNVPTENLVAHYPFSGNANDASGNGHHGTVFGATLTTDRFGNPEGAYHFVASEGNYIRVPDDPQLQITTNLSISVWMKHNATAGGFEDIVMKGNDTYGFQFNSGSHEVLFHLKQAGGSWRNLNSLHTPVPDQWFHIAGTYDGIIQRVFINGVQTNYSNWYGAIHNSANPLDFGYKVWGDNDWYNGDLDDFRVYDRTLSADEVMQLYNEASNYLGVPSGVEVTYSGGNVTVSWQEVNGADSYQVYSSSEPYQDFSLDHSGDFDGTSWTAPATQTKRFYHVRAIND
jgi:hypothetical protein